LKKQISGHPMVARDFKINILPVSRKLMRFATQLLRDEEEARDAVQDVFLKLWQKRDELSGIENIEAFAVKMTRNRCLDIIRANRSAETRNEGVGLTFREVNDVHLQIELNETAKQVRHLISQLPELQKRVMQLRDIEQFEFEEIAEITGMNANAIRVNLSRARKKVRDELIKADENETRRNKRNITSVF
jgi:RNA polymerase sigma factor (sigma-70 family)